MPDREKMILILTVLSLLGRRTSPEEVQRAYQTAQQEYQDYEDRENLRPPSSR